MSTILKELVKAAGYALDLLGSSYAPARIAPSNEVKPQSRLDEVTADRALCATELSHHDQILQYYRTIHLTVQSLILAAGAVLTTTIVPAGSVAVKWWLFGLLVLFWVSMLWVQLVMRRTIAHRGKYVHFWQHKLEALDVEFPEERRFYKEFRMLRESETGYPSATGKDAGYLKQWDHSPARRSLDVVPICAINFIWISLLVGAVIVILKSPPATQEIALSGLPGRVMGVLA